MTGKVSKFLRAKHAYLAIYLFRQPLSFRVAALPVYFASLKLNSFGFYTFIRLVNLVSIKCIDLKEKFHDRSIKSRQHKMNESLLLSSIQHSLFCSILSDTVAVDETIVLSLKGSLSSRPTLLLCLHLENYILHKAGQAERGKSRLHLRDLPTL